MYEIFERINTGSEKLTAQEIRNAIYLGELLDELKEICNTSATKILYFNPEYEISSLLIKNLLFHSYDNPCSLEDY